MTFGTADARFHSHSYYDIPVIGPDGRRVLAYRTNFTLRQPTPDDNVEIGVVDLEEPGSWQPLAETAAWSWQQGPMAQWIGEDAACFNDRSGDRFEARVLNLATGAERRLSRPIYAVAQKSGFGLSLDMARLEVVRPGYGYAGGAADAASTHAPDNDGVWRVPMDGEEPELVLSLADAVQALRGFLPLRERLRHRFAGYTYWFNHTKISPDETRFTVKLRWRRIGGPWNEGMGVSLTCGADGSDIRILTNATSHVMWMSDQQLYAWRAGELAVFADEVPQGQRLGVLGGGAIDENVHMRHLPTSSTQDPDVLIYDTPYREEITLYWQERDQEREIMDVFAGHDPKRGPYRCDLHPVPLPGGDGALVTSLRDGGRQLYVVRKHD